ncbi:MAG: diaminopimelate decarboxylase [Sedimentisphaerales bacterium]|nr:diaminopimelate decarboxylase [Sedimentisphaerales bacterium]
MVDHFHYRHQELYAEQVPVAAIADQAATPVYIYSAATFREHYRRLQQAFAECAPLICYSVKSCGNVHILRMLAELGSGFDVVSGGELYRVLQAGGPAGRVVYAGVGKTQSEILQAMEAGIACFNIESEAELEAVGALAAGRKQTVRAALRVNPDVDPRTHRHTSTGQKETKFGVDIERARQVFARYGRQPHLSLTGIHLHIGSPINSTEPYVQAVKKVLDLIAELRREGIAIETLNIGGGFGADYTTGQAPAADLYAEALIPLLRGQDLELILEPGRSISANAGIFVTRLLYLKQGGEKTFAIVDGAMNDLIRPVLYDAFHFLWPTAVSPDHVITNRCREPDLPGLRPYDVVGPICETGDCLAKDRLLPPLKPGDLLAVFTAGAYGFVMSSQYNSRPRAAEVLVDSDRFEIIRRRETYGDLIAHEIA